MRNIGREHPTMLITNAHQLTTKQHVGNGPSGYVVLRTELMHEQLTLEKRDQTGLQTNRPAALGHREANSARGLKLARALTSLSAIELRAARSETFAIPRAAAIRTPAPVTGGELPTPGRGGLTAPRRVPDLPDWTALAPTLAVIPEQGWASTSEVLMETRQPS